MRPERWVCSPGASAPGDGLPAQWADRKPQHALEAALTILQIDLWIDPGPTLTPTLGYRPVTSSFVTAP
jgi:hypothetical protein